MVHGFFFYYNYRHSCCHLAIAAKQLLGRSNGDQGGNTCSHAISAIPHIPPCAGVVVVPIPPTLTSKRPRIPPALRPKESRR